MTTTAATALFRGLIPSATGSGSAKAGAQGGDGAIFARLLAAVGGMMRGEIGPGPRPVQFQVPGDAATAVAAVTDLRSSLAELLASAQARLQGLTDAPAGSAAEGVGEILRETADAVAGLLATFDAATGANALVAVRAELGRIAAARGLALPDAPVPASADGVPAAGDTLSAPADAALTELALLTGRLGIVLQTPGAAPQPAELPQDAVPAVTFQTAAPPSRPAQVVPQPAPTTVPTEPLQPTGPLQPAATDPDRSQAPAPAPAVPAPRAEPKGLVPELAAALDRIAPASGQATPEIRPPVLPQATTMTPVTVVEPAATMPDLSNKVQAQIRGRSFEEGTTRIELSPRGLGDLEIELSPDEAGRLRVVIRAESPAVLAALRTDRDALMGLLRDSGTQVANSGLSFEGFGARQGSGRQQRGRAEGTTTAAMPSEPEAQPDPIRRPASGRIDILT